VTISQTGTTSISHVEVTSGDAVNAYSIPVQISGLSIAISNTGSPTSPTITKMIIATTGATSSSTQSSSGTTLAASTMDNSSTQSSGLSTGGKASICVGIFFGVAIVSLIGLCWGKIRRRTQGHVHLSTAPNRVELPINSVSELPTDYAPAILPLS
jgi:hypothetical protein